MRAINKSKISGVRWVSDQEMASIVDKRARAVLNISGPTFTKRRRRGEYKKLDTDTCPGIVELALLAPSVKNGKARGGKNS
jgi:hypothetical protein